MQSVFVTIQTAFYEITGAGGEGGGDTSSRVHLFSHACKTSSSFRARRCISKNKMVIFLCLMHCELVHGENLSRLIINLNYPGRRVGGFYLSIYNKAQFISYITGCWCPYFISFTFYQHNNSVKHVETS